jgi:hypothetical protein
MKRHEAIMMKYFSSLVFCATHRKKTQKPNRNTQGLFTQLRCKMFRYRATKGLHKKLLCVQFHCLLAISTGSTNTTLKTTNTGNNTCNKKSDFFRRKKHACTNAITTAASMPLSFFPTHTTAQCEYCKNYIACVFASINNAYKRFQKKRKE